ncbi:hypothetical protein OKA05_00265 [Luteolibacter arcticus]|uniref:TIGR04222 domain-containing membrane protein n=1 Tax=Luteolibacter arcticus TaxID=1581411 RepID=A0ABT3GBH1_9BACT|nr:hypothetical protein [Luteolibacter arcticus]MCW1920965.1 hypothetical protein [Luteolibacter arcticus]
MKDELLLRLESFEIDEPGATFPFSARLARENGWTRGFALRVMAEYKRFVWLAIRAGHPVTPSEEVDEAWHLHLCYTRSYWDGMCGGILGKPLHHGPTEGGKREDEKFAGWYARTLESYRAHFGEEPPADIWPPLAIRFSPATTRKVDAATHWIVPKRTAKRVLLGSAAVATLPALAGCTNLLAATGPEGLFCFFGMALFLVVIVVVSKRGGRGGNGCGSGGGTTSSCGGGGSSGCGSNGGDGGSSSGCGSSGCSSSGCGGGGGGGGD